MASESGIDPKEGAQETVTGPAPAGPNAENIDLTVGSTDSYGNKVLRIFHKALGKYIIYEVGNLDIMISGDLSGVAGKVKINQLLENISDYRIRFPFIRKKYNPRQALALRLALDGETAGCEQLLETISESIPRYLLRISQLLYVSGSISLLLLTLILFGVSWIRHWLSPFGIEIYTAIVFAAMGGVMSVAIGLRKLELSLDDALWVTFFYGALRVLIAMIAGIIILFLIESKFALTFLKDPSASPYGFAIAAFLSGFSEMLVPNLMKKMEDQSAGSQGGDHE
jgi:hypothetical protein